MGTALARRTAPGTLPPFCSRGQRGPCANSPPLVSAGPFFLVGTNMLRTSGIEEYPTRRLLSEAARETIRAAIFSGEIAPGERLDEPTLEIWLGVSRTPIREALMMLRAEGLVETRTSRTPHVISSDPSHTPDALRSLGAVMASTLAFVLETEDPQVPAGIQDAAASAHQALVAGDHDAHLQAMSGLHATLIEHCPNTFHRQLAEESVRKLGYHLRVASTADSFQRGAAS